MDKQICCLMKVMMDLLSKIEYHFIFFVVIILKNT